jgi:hypothetical protein
MALRGKLEVDIELKSNADKYWKVISDTTTLFPKAFPHDYKSIEVLAGDGRSAGSIRHFTYAEGKIIDFLLLYNEGHFMYKQKFFFFAE